MKIHIITIFPEAFHSYLNTSIAKNSIEKKILEIKLYKLNNFSYNKNKRVDERAYGMHGQVIKADILERSIKYLFNKIGEKVPIIYMSPSGNLLNQTKIENYFEFLGEEFIIICGHYEGIDQRFIDKYVNFEISIGEYVITSGELARQIFIDSIIRFEKGVLGNTKSFEEESFSKKLNRQKEYPVYTQPKSFNGVDVPEILLSGNHNEIETWKFKNLKY